MPDLQRSSMRFWSEHARGGERGTAALRGYCIAVAAIEKNLPFGLLDIEAKLSSLGFFADGRLAFVNERKRVPFALEHFGEDVKNGMLADAPIPIFGIREVAFAAMHDRVPVAAFGRVDSL